MSDYANDSKRRAKMRKRLAQLNLPCAICGQPIDYTLGMVRREDGRMVPHPDRFELDHIEARANGGDHWDMANAQPTHRRCNLAKGRGTPKGAPRPKTDEPRPGWSADW